MWNHFDIRLFNGDVVIDPTAVSFFAVCACMFVREPCYAVGGVCFGPNRTFLYDETLVMPHVYTGHNLFVLDLVSIFCFLTCHVLVVLDFVVLC